MKLLCYFLLLWSVGDFSSLARWVERRKRPILCDAAPDAHVLDKQQISTGHVRLIHVFT